MKQIIIPYKPREVWQEIHQELDVKRHGVIVAHRRFGKTVGAIMQLIKKATECKERSPIFYYLNPLLKQAKRVAWGYLRYYTSFIPDIKVNHSELYVEFPSNYSKSDGARIYIMGADNPDSLRGNYLDGIVLDEYAQMKPEVWGEIIRPALADRKGWALFIGTPKGQNSFYSMYKFALSNEGWLAYKKGIDETDVLDAEEIKEMKQEMTENIIRQELYCDFTASSENVLITLDDYNDSIDREIDHTGTADLPVIVGVDPARFGDDSSVIVIRKGYEMLEPFVYKKLDQMELADRVAYVIDKYKADMTFIDIGLGAGVVDRLRRLGYNKVIEVAFGGNALDTRRFINKRTEIWFKMAEWIKQGGKLYKNDRLSIELTSSEYTYDESKIRLASKQRMKQIIGFSPDIADAIALTFTQTVNKTVNRLKVANTKSNLFNR